MALKISLLERGLLRNDDLATTYRQWLTDETAKSATFGRSLITRETVPSDTWALRATS
jgi:hypothetical protein